MCIDIRKHKSSWCTADTMRFCRRADTLWRWTRSPFSPCSEVGAGHAQQPWGHHGLCAHHPSVRKPQKAETNEDNVLLVCGQKEKERRFSNTSCFSWGKVGSRMFCTNYLQCLPVGFCLVFGLVWVFVFAWFVVLFCFVFPRGVEVSVFGWGKEHTLPEFGKGTIMPR